MKRVISKSTYQFLFVTALLAIVSCTKQEDKSLQQEDAGLTRTTADLSGPLSNCGEIPQDLNPPAGNKLLTQAYASGVQIYEVRRNTIDPTKYEWVNTAPAATLYLKPDYTNPVGLHYKGPTWEFMKGVFKDDKVVASKLKGIVVDASAVAWLLLKTVDSLSSPGNRITYIQRTCTNGGLPPSTAASESNLGALDSIPYTAIYSFYIKD